MKNLLKKLSRDERGVSALEYAILAAVIVGAVVTAVAGFGDELADVFGELTGLVSTEIGKVGQ